MLVQSFSEMEEMIMKHNFTITKTLIAGSDQDPTKIYEGTHGDPKDGVSWGKREAAIKRIPKADREKAIIQTRAYMELDQMPKIVRCHGRRRFLLHLFWRERTAISRSFYGRSHKNQILLDMKTQNKGFLGKQHKL
jgi:hypothetical protein